MKNQKSVFEFGEEYVCTEFYDADLSTSGVDVSCNDNHLGQILGLSIPDIDDEESNMKFDKDVIAWIVDNEK